MIVYFTDGTLSLYGMFLEQAEALKNVKDEEKNGQPIKDCTVKDFCKSIYPEAFKGKEEDE